MTELENKTTVEISEKEQKVQEVNNEVFQTIMQHLFSNGKLLIVGLGGCGKTNLAFHLVRYIMGTQEYRDGKTSIKITDSASIWKNEFDRIPYIDVTKKSTFPEDERALILDLGFLSTNRNVALLENLVGQDFYIQRDSMNKNNGCPEISRIYILEEVQNLFSSYKKSEFWLRIWSESRNYKMYFIGLAQRLSDVSTRIVERTKWMLIGSLSGDNDLAKIRRAFGRETGERVIHEIQSLRQSEFLLVDTQNPENSLKIYFPKFVANGQPYEYDNKNNGYIKVSRIFL